LLVGHTGRGGVVLVGLANAMRALPTLGLLTFLFLLVRSQAISTLVALVVLAVPPVLAGSYAGVRSVDAGVVDAARGMGMTSAQRLGQVELPGALALLLGGVRSAVLQVVATTTVAAYVGLGRAGPIAARRPQFSRLPADGGRRARHCSAGVDAGPATGRVGAAHGAHWLPAEPAIR
jgi:osmoprotectant transport system permease protein